MVVVFCVVCLFAFLFLFLLICKQTGEQNTVLSFISLSLGLLWNVLLRKQGKLPAKWKVNEDGIVMIRKDVKEMLSRTNIKWKVNTMNYLHYRFICGYTSIYHAISPPCYFETACIGHCTSIISQKEFPLSPMALIHISQTIKVYCPLHIESTPEVILECGLAGVRVVSKGVEIDLLCKVTHNDCLVWESNMTLLSRNKSTRSRNKARGVADNQSGQSPNVPRPNNSGSFNHEIDKESDLNSVEFNVPVSIGWEYAKVSSDYSPHHLNRFTSKLVGYPYPMAHGMWTLARTMAILDDKVDSSAHSLYPLIISAQFKRPLFIPNTATLAYQCITPSTDHDDLIFTQYKCKDNNSMTILFDVFSGNISSNGNNLNMTGFATFNAKI